MVNNNLNLGKLAINSTAYYILAVLALYLCQYTIMYLVGNYWTLRMEITYYGMEAYPIEWRPRGIIYTYMAGPLLAMFLSVVARYFIVNFYRGGSASMRMFLNWVQIHGFNVLFGGIIIGVVFFRQSVLTYRGIGHSIEWAQMGYAIMYMLGVVSLLIMLFLGFGSPRMFLSLAPNHDMISWEFNARPKFIIASAIIPWILGTGFLAVMQYPKLRPFELLLALALLTVMVPMLTATKLFKVIRLKKDEDNIPIDWTGIGLALGALVIWRILLIPHGPL